MRGKRTTLEELVVDESWFAAEHLNEWLSEDDKRTRLTRVARLQLLLSEYGDERTVRMFPGGPVSGLAFEEARLAFLHGLFLSCVILCQTCVEHMLAGLFRIEGRDDLDRANFHHLLREARNERFITAEEFGLFDRLRELRNPYVHTRAPGDPTSLMRRAVNMDTPFEDFVVEDAEYAITTLLRLCRRPPFGL